MGESELLVEVKSERGAAGGGDSSGGKRKVDELSELELTNPTLFHQLKKGRRKRGPKWTVPQTEELLDALNAYVVQYGYPSSSEHGKSDEWLTICRSARQDGCFSGYQACNRVSNLRKDLNAYIATTHLRFLSDAPDIARSIAHYHHPHSTEEKAREILQSIRDSTRMVEDWCGMLELHEGCAYYEEGYTPRCTQRPATASTLPLPLANSQLAGCMCCARWTVRAASLCLRLRALRPLLCR